jgi:hypothetical protein
LVFAVFSSFALVVGLSCSGSDDDSGSTKVCKDYCEAIVEGYGECLDDEGCWWEDPDDVEDDCKSECEKAFDDLDYEDREEATDCLDCLADEIGGSPDCYDYFDAFEECENKCDDHGAEEFFEEMDEIEGDIDCDYDSDYCPGYTGSSSCCMVDDPCDWADDGYCDCDDTCSWDWYDCEYY